MTPRVLAVQIIAIPALVLAACLAPGGTTRTDQSPEATGASPNGSAAASSPTREACSGPDFDWSHSPEIVQAWGAFWNEDDRAAKTAILDRIWAEGATYTDPFGDGPILDRELLLDTAEYGVGPGQYIELRGWAPDDLHHDRIRMRWRHCCPSGTSYLSGTDIGWIDPEGRFTKVVSFWSTPVEAPAAEAC